MSQLCNDELAVLYLSYLGVSRKRLVELLKFTQTPYETIINQPLPKQVEEILGKDNIEKLLEYDAKASINNLKESLTNEKDINIVTIMDDKFPTSLTQIPDPPLYFFYMGDLSILSDENILGVVGTRKPSPYGVSVTESFVSELAKNGVVTASGLAYGIDSIVAKTSLKENCKTIAVLGSGLRNIYPSSNAGLAKKIVEAGGLVMSEYFPGIGPTKYTFPERNRLISGISRGTLVIEAGEKSGSLITANFAIEQAKELFVVPGNINSINSKGSNLLIDELPDSFTISPQRILKSFGLTTEAVKEQKTYQYSMEEQRIIDVLSNGEKTTDELCEILKEDFKTLNLLLTEMEISGIIRKLSGDYYSI